ncbi:hypothetical protein ACFVFQ_36720 [Streptomyces sp. NPDC057743]|uniref:hypothetical protein n=1 Tax=Streptomyces sp. NPDC057743 TaxID=3346236 RepID=UPI00369093FB
MTLCTALLGLTTVSDAFPYLSSSNSGLFPLLPLGTAAVFFLAGHAALLLAYGPSHVRTIM